MNFREKVNIWLKTFPPVAEARRRVDVAIAEHKERMKKMREEKKR